MTKRPPPPLWKMLSWATQLSGVSLELGTCVVLGWWGDRRWGTEPWLLVAGSGIGLTVSLLHLWQVVERMDRDDSSGPRQSSLEK